MILMITFLIRYTLNRITMRFKHIGWPVGFESNVSVFNSNFISLGNNVFVGKNVIIQIPDEFKNHKGKPELTIKNKVTIGMGSCISAIKKIVIENNVLIAQNVYIADHRHKYEDVDKPIRYQGMDKISPVIIKDGAWICANSVINPGVTIGKNAVIGANSIVSKDVPDYAVAVGSPAKVIRQYNFKEKKWIKV